MKTTTARRKYMRDYMRKRYAENPVARAKQISQVLARYYCGGQDIVRAKNKKLKKEVLTHYGPEHRLGCCWRGCAVSDLDMLSLDHINNDGAKHRKAFTGSIYPWVKSHKFPLGFQTLCYNHQWKKQILLLSGSCGQAVIRVTPDRNSA